MNKSKLRSKVLALGVTALLTGVTGAWAQSANEEQRRTRPHAEAIGPRSGLSLVGTVESWNDEALQVRTTTGIENIVLTPDTRIRVDLDKGDRVAVDYWRSTNGVMTADQVRPASEVKGVDSDREVMSATENVKVYQTPMPNPVFGQVLFHDRGALLLQTPDRHALMVLTPATRMGLELAPGSRVTVEYEKVGDGTWVATSVRSAPMDSAARNQR